MCVLEKLPVKRKRIISVKRNSPFFPTSPATPPIQNPIALSSIFEALAPTPVTKFALP